MHKINEARLAVVPAVLIGACGAIAGFIYQGRRAVGKLLHGFALHRRAAWSDGGWQQGVRPSAALAGLFAVVAPSMIAPYALVPATDLV